MAASPDLTHPLVAKAYALAQRAHAGQLRRGWAYDVPYLRHVDKVMLRSPKDPISQAVAALHDSMESDCAHPLKDVDLPSEVIRGILALTRDETTETYEEFIERVKRSDGGRWVRVKIADILSNLADVPTDVQILKYSRALQALLS